MRLLANQGASAFFYHGDGRRLDLLPDGSVQLVATSPPYFNARDYAGWESYAAYLADMALVLVEAHRVLCDGGRIAINVPLGYGRPGSGGYLPIGPDWVRLLQDAGFTMRGHIVWAKGGATARGSTAWGSWCSPSNPSLRDDNEVVLIAHKGSARLAARGRPATITAAEFQAWTVSTWQIPPAPHSWHPAPWPAELPRRLIQLYTYAGDTVLDPFAGSFTTVYEAAAAGRVGIGVERIEEYVREAAGPLLCAPPPPELVAAVDLALQNNQGALEALRLL